MYEKTGNKKTLIAVVVFAWIGWTGCTDHFDSLNIPKDQLVAEEVDESLLGQAFAHAQYRGMTLWYQGSHNLYADEWVQFVSTLHPNFPSGQFVEVGSWTNLFYNSFYGDWAGSPARSLHFVETFSEENGLTLNNAVAKLWRVQLYHRITDYFGPIIYSEFGNGETIVAFDSQEDVYMDFFDTLDEVLAVLQQNQGGNVFGAHDQVFNGSVDAHLKWANSLRLRLAMRLSYVEPGFARDQAELALNSPGGVFTSNEDNALLASTEQSVNKYSSINYHVEFVMSAAMESVLSGYEDPRLGVYWNRCCGRLGGDGDYTGFRNGAPPDEKGFSLISEKSFVGPDWLPIADGGRNPPDRLMEAAEVYFLRAEGALRGWNMGGSARELYEEGIRHSLIERTSASMQAIEDYVNSTNTPVALNDEYDSPPVSDIPIQWEDDGGFERNLEQTQTQKWISLYPENGWEAFSERRRTGYPRGYAIIDSRNPRISETELVRRLRFSGLEWTNNASATQEAESLLNGPDENDTRLWWDTKPLADYPTPTDPK